MRPLLLLLIGAIFGFMAGFLVAAGYEITLNGHDHDTDHQHTTTDY